MAKVKVRWIGPDRYYPDLRQTVTAGDELEIEASDQNEYTEPIGATKPKAKKET